MSRLLSLAFPFLDEGMRTAISADRAAAEDAALQMDEDAFRGFYGRTAAMVWAYLSKATGDRSAADDLLQETFYRFLRAKVAFESEAHRRNYVFRIAMNLVRDRHRRPRLDAAPLPDESQLRAAGNLAVETQTRTDLQRAMSHLKPRERDLLWLAYGQGSSHEEIAGSLGLKTGSIKPLVFRARRKLAGILQAQGLGHRGQGSGKAQGSKDGSGLKAQD
jgi:RNA polymerase sigma-70 factor (ECF subfamily)